MSTYTGTGTTVVLSTTLPADNADLMASDVNVPLETLFNNDAALEQALAWSAPVAGLATVELELGALANLAVTGAADNGSGLIQLHVVAHGLHQGDLIQVSGVVGTVEANDSWIVSPSDSDHLDLLNSAFANAYVSGGAVTRRVQVAYGNTYRAATRKLGTPWTDGPLPIPTPTRGWTPTGTFATGDVLQNINPAPTTQTQIVGWSIDEGIAPMGARLTSVTVYYQPSNGHGALPVTQPVVAVYKRIFGSATAPTTLGTVTDTAATVGAYQGYRKLTVTFTAEPLDHYHCKYFVIFTTETGTNALEGISVFGADCTVGTRTLKQD